MRSTAWRACSLDMRVVDPAWIGMKLRKLLNYAEPLGHFMAFVPGQRRQQVWPSTVSAATRPDPPRRVRFLHRVRVRGTVR